MAPSSLDVTLLNAAADAAVSRVLSKLPNYSVRPATVQTADQGGSRSVYVTYDGDLVSVPVQAAANGWYAPGTRVLVLQVPPAGAIIIGTVNGGYDSWHTVTLTAGWSNYTAAANNYLAGYRREGDRVWLRGVIAGGSLNVPIFTPALPTPYRPPRNVPSRGICNGGGSVYVSILTDGTVRVVVAPDVTWVSLEGISFTLQL